MIVLVRQVVFTLKINLQAGIKKRPHTYLSLRDMPCIRYDSSLDILADRKGNPLVRNIRTIVKDRKFSTQKDEEIAPSHTSKLVLSIRHTKLLMDCNTDDTKKGKNVQEGIHKENRTDKNETSHIRHLNKSDEIFSSMEALKLEICLKMAHKDSEACDNEKPREIRINSNI